MMAASASAFNAQGSVDRSTSPAGAKRPGVAAEEELDGRHAERRLVGGLLFRNVKPGKNYQVSVPPRAKRRNRLRSTTGFGAVGSSIYNESIPTTATPI